jgi:HAD superfamily hydrolase (TIGR01509 family)
VRLGLVSGSPRRDIDLVLSLTGLAAEFPVIVAAEDVAAGKPDPEGFLKAAKILGVRPGETWVIEDSESGVSAGRAAGCRVIAVPTRYTMAHDFSAAERVMKDYSQVAEFLFCLPDAG